jgi:uncharacterized protein (TIGR02466 family)
MEAGSVRLTVRAHYARFDAARRAGYSAYMSTTENLFVTKLHRAELGRRLNAELERTCLAIAAEDRAGQRWAREHGYEGYTSYASLNDLTVRASVFEALERLIAIEVHSFAKALDVERPRALKLDSLWINVMPKGGVHTAHIHPQSAISGTYYVTTPNGAAALKFEDPRLAMMMAAPAKKAKAKRENQSFVSIAPKPGTLLLWESFLRHEVPLNRARGQRISISFNYA